MWQVLIPKKIIKDLNAFPESLSAGFLALIKTIQNLGPVRGDWPNYSRLGATAHHCHVQKGRPTYVMIWKVLDSKAKKIEVIYAGTHEKADYKRVR